MGRALPNLVRKPVEDTTLFAPFFGHLIASAFVKVLFCFHLVEKMTVMKTTHYDDHYEVILIGKGSKTKWKSLMAFAIKRRTTGMENHKSAVNLTR